MIQEYLLNYKKIWGAGESSWISPCPFLDLDSVLEVYKSSIATVGLLTQNIDVPLYLPNFLK